MSFTAACTKCNKTFMADSYAKAKSARDVHRRTCVSSFQVEYPNATVTLSRQSNTGDFVCICSLYPAGHSFNSTHNVKKHVTLSKCHWVGPTETGSTPSSQQGIATTSAMAMDVDKLGIAYNKALPGLICIACEVALAPNRIVEHIKYKHADCGIPLNRTLIEEDVQALGVSNGFPPVDLTPRPEIQGLTVYSAFQCHACSKVYVSQPTMIKHHQEHHKEIPMPPSWNTVYAQQLNHALERSYFPIIPAAPPQVSATEAIVTNLHAAIVALDGRPTGHRLDPRLVSPWLKSNRWPELIQGKSVESLRAMIAPLKENEYPTLVPAIQELFIGSEELFELVPELVLQRINTPDPVKT
ncbi:hypothetical protein C0993_008560 [Termitomyces sp. T159_Od127]|nr:hypothetical protein C0993_008560 [Termitomyces sp. T159_Od127]